MEKIKVLNTWKSTEAELQYYSFDKDQVVWKSEDHEYMIISQTLGSYLHVFQGVAFGCYRFRFVQMMKDFMNSKMPEEGMPVARKEYFKRGEMILKAMELLQRHSVPVYEFEKPLKSQ